MRVMGLCLVAACGRSGGGPAKVELATPAEAKAIATKLAAALTACDRSAVAATLALKYLGARATDDKSFIKLVVEDTITCDELAVEVVDRAPPNDARPLLRWRHGNTTDCELRSFGYAELTVDKTGRIADLEAPMHPQTVVTSLGNIHANLPPGDWPGMISDIMSGPFSGIYTGATFASQLGDPPHAVTTERQQNLDNVIEYAFRSHDYSAVQVAVNKVAAIVGEDPLLASVRIAAAIGAKQGDYALVLAQDATAKWPNDFDAWCVRLPAEIAGGTKASIDETKQTLATRFKIEAR